MTPESKASAGSETRQKWPAYTCAAILIEAMVRGACWLFGLNWDSSYTVMIWASIVMMYVEREK